MLEANVGLGASLDARTRSQANAELEAPAVVLEPGRWAPPEAAPGHLGFLVVDGLIARHLAVSGGRCVELLGSGDLLRPWQADAASFVRADWRVLQRTEVALLGPELIARMCRYPPLVEDLVERMMQRARSLAVFSAIDNVVGVEKRLHLLLWHLAERWGRSEADGVTMPLQLTHQMLADLVGSRRPTITTALRSLVEDGTIAEDGSGGWRLEGAPPEMPSG